MAINDHAETFLELPVKPYDPEEGLEDPAGHAYRLALTWDDQDAGRDMTELLEEMLEDPKVGQLRALVIGAWNFDSSEDSSEIISTLVAYAAKLGGLRGLFLGDVVVEEQEISWIQQSDITPLLEAFPLLETLRVRGGTELVLRPTTHPNLASLIIETGGLAREVVQGALSCTFPRLRTLELWTGDEEYGATCGISDFEPLLRGNAFPELQSLGIRNSQFADEAAAALATSPRTRRLRRVDLSMGCLTDEGARAILAHKDAFSGLELLDLHHHYLTEPVMKALQSSGLRVNLDDVCTPDEWDGEPHRYVAVGE